jgi:beta-glucosidase
MTHHYYLYKKDLSLLKELGVNAYRFSLEWSRIQPEEDQWSMEAIQHYQDIIDILHREDIEPMVTLHHFTHPLWYLKTSPWLLPRRPHSIHISLRVDPSFNKNLIFS